MGRLRTIWAWLRWPLAIGILFALLWQKRDDFQHFASQEKQWSYLWLALGLCGLGSWLTFVRWYWLAHALGFHFPLREACRLGLMGLALSYVGPGLIGGDAFKAVFIASGQASRRVVAAATVFLDRILGLIALLFVGATATLFVPELPPSPLHTSVKLIFWTGAGCGALGLALALWPAFTRSRLVRWLEHLPGVGKTFESLLEGVALYQSRPWVPIGATALAYVGHIATIGGFFACALALGGWAPPFLTHLYFMPAAEVVGLLPTPGGIGPLEWAIQEAYGSAAIPPMTPENAKQAGFMAALAFRLINIVIAAFGAIFYLAARQQVATAMQVEQVSNAEQAP